MMYCLINSLLLHLDCKEMVDVLFELLLRGKLVEGVADLLETSERSRLE